MIVSHRHRFIFMKTRKTAGTSIELALARVCGPDDTITSLSDKDEELRRQAGLPGPQNVDAPPLNRRAFNHMPAKMAKRAVGPRVWHDYFTFAVERNPWDAVVSAYFWTFREREAPPFGEWVRGPQVDDLAKNSQMYRIKGEIAVDRVVRYETLSAELAEVWAQLDLPGSPDLPHAKSTSRPEGADYRELYDDVSRERVAAAFAHTIADLGYTF
jgi:Sulfotransferase family